MCGIENEADGNRLMWEIYNWELEGSRVLEYSVREKKSTDWLIIEFAKLYIW